MRLDAALGGSSRTTVAGLLVGTVPFAAGWLIAMNSLASRTLATGQVGSQNVKAGDAAFELTYLALLPTIYAAFLLQKRAAVVARRAAAFFLLVGSALGFGLWQFVGCGQAPTDCAQLAVRSWAISLLFPGLIALLGLMLIRFVLIALARRQISGHIQDSVSRDVR
jgi:hypothetical protein